MTTTDVELPAVVLDDMLCLLCTNLLCTKYPIVLRQRLLEIVNDCLSLKPTGYYYISKDGEDQQQQQNRLPMPRDIANLLKVCTKEFLKINLGRHTISMTITLNFVLREL